MNQSIQWNVSQGFNVAVTTICSPAGFLGDVVSIRTLKGSEELMGNFRFFPLQCQQEGGKKGKVSFDLSFKTTRRMWMFWNKSSGIKPYHGTNLRPKLLSFTASKKHKNKIDLPKRQPIFDGFRSTTLVCHEPKIHPNDPTKDREWMREMDENCVCVYLYIYIYIYPWMSNSTIFWMIISGKTPLF